MNELMQILQITLEVPHNSVPRVHAVLEELRYTEELPLFITVGFRHEDGSLHEYAPLRLGFELVEKRYEVRRGIEKCGEIRHYFGVAAGALDEFETFWKSHFLAISCPETVLAWVDGQWKSLDAWLHREQEHRSRYAAAFPSDDLPTVRL